MINAEPVVAAVDKIVRRVNSQLAPFEQIRGNSASSHAIFQSSVES